MNNLVQQFDPESQAVSLTQAALQHLKQQLAKRGSGVGMRLAIKKSGCSGYAYVVDYVDEPNDEDKCYPLVDNLAIYVDMKSLPFVQGTQIDYIKEGLNARFVFQNPNEQGSCGCGESFSV